VIWLAVKMVVGSYDHMTTRFSLPVEPGATIGELSKHDSLRNTDEVSLGVVYV